METQSRRIARREPKSWKSSPKRVTRVASLLSAVMLLFAGSAFAGGLPLQGVWEINGKPDGGSPFTNVATIDRHGYVVNVDPAFGTAVGRTFRIGTRRYATGFWGFFLDEDGNLLRYEVQGTLRRRGLTRVEGTFTTIFTDPGGNELFRTMGTIDGRRLHPQPDPGNP